MNIHSIAEKLYSYSEKLENGTLSGDEILMLTDLSREFYERMIVLRFKSVEESIENTADTGEEEEIGMAAENPAESIEQEAPQTKEAPEIEEEIEDNPIFENKPEPEPIEVAEVQEEPVSTYGPTVSPNQISLIDSIEEIKQMEQSLNETFKQESTTLAQKLHRKPISDLKSAVTINQKFQFISHLFAKDADAFNKAIDRLNGCATYLEADEYIQNNLISTYDWDMKSPPVKEMMDLVERKFL